METDVGVRIVNAKDQINLNIISTYNIFFDCSQRCCLDKSDDLETKQIEKKTWIMVYFIELIIYLNGGA